MRCVRAPAPRECRRRPREGRRRSPPPACRADPAGADHPRRAVRCDPTGRHAAAVVTLPPVPDATGPGPDRDTGPAGPTPSRPRPAHRDGSVHRDGASHFDGPTHPDGPSQSGRPTGRRARPPGPAGDRPSIGPSRHARRHDLRAVTETLIAEFAGRQSAGAVLRSVALSVRELRLAGVRQGLPYAAEAMARQRLLRRLDGTASSPSADPRHRPGVTAAGPQIRPTSPAVDREA
jgi:hypothetical protein